MVEARDVAMGQHGVAGEMGRGDEATRAEEAARMNVTRETDFVENPGEKVEEDIEKSTSRWVSQNT